MSRTLERLLSSKVKAAVLDLLFCQEGRELHVRELARQAGLAEGTVRQELNRLAALGVVASRRSGNRTYYRAETSHPLYTDLRGLALKTGGLADVLREALGSSDVTVAFVFGSVARGTDTAGKAQLFQWVVSHWRLARARASIHRIPKGEGPCPA